jgi:3-oxoadipate enol-lactonase
LLRLKVAETTERDHVHLSEIRVAVIDAESCPLYVEVEGPAAAPVLMLSNSLGTNLNIWDEQASVWSRHFRLIRYDRRGHGRSGVTPGPYSMERLGKDALAIMDALNVSKINWCGLSMGGMVGQWLAAHAPQRIDKLILSNTSCYYPDKEPWNQRIQTIRAGGLETIADALMKLWFTADFRARSPDTVARIKEALVATPIDGYIASCEAVRDMDHRGILAKINSPTLVIAGRHDTATPVAAAEFIRSHIPRASLTVLDAAHISNVEQPAFFVAEVLGFLTQAKT